MSDEIIDINTREPIVAIAKRDWVACGCRKLWIDAHERKVTCRDCGKVIDPFEWLKGFANHEAGLIQRLEYLESETKERYQKVDALKAEEQKVKARIRAAKTSLLGTMGI